MRMRAYHGALLLVLAMVMAMLSTGICTGTAPVPAPAPTASSVEFPMPQHRCVKILSNDSDCDQKACNANCFTNLKGAGACVHGSVRVPCWCNYPCKSPPPAARMVTD